MFVFAFQTISIINRLLMLRTHTLMAIERLDQIELNMFEHEHDLRCTHLYAI